MFKEKTRQGIQINSIHRKALLGLLCRIEALHLLPFKSKKPALYLYF